MCVNREPAGRTTTMTFEPTCLADPAELFTEIEQVLGGDGR